MTHLRPRKYSERLGVITPEQLQMACDLFESGSVEEAEPASAGLWGQNILLSTTHGQFVLRGNAEPHRLRKEQVVAAAIHERSSIPVPWPYQVSDDSRIFGWPFAIMPVMPGTMGAAIWDAADTQQRLELSAAHGDALAALHQTTFGAPGPYDEERAMFAEVDDYREWTLQRIHSLRTRCRAIGALQADAELFIDTLIQGCEHALSEPFTPVLVHHDFSLANTSYQRIDDAVLVSGLFDLGEAHVGDGEEDLPRFLFRRKREQCEAFVRAYVKHRPFRPGVKDRLALYALADLLFMWEVSKRMTNWFGDAPFVDVAKPVIEKVRIAAG